MGFRKPALTKEFVVYSLSDPCVEAIDAEKYLETLDRQYLKISDGASEFTIMPISTSQKIEALPSGREATAKEAYQHCEYIVRCSWTHVTNFEVGGKPLELQKKDGMVTRETIDQIQDEGLIFELAAYGRQISHLPQ